MLEFVTLRRDEERLRVNPNLIRSRFGAVVALIDMITVLSVLLTGAALIRERERGTVEHLLVMPVTPFEIMTSKIWSMGLVVLTASAVSMVVVVEGLLKVPIQGSCALFLCGAALHTVAATSLGMFLATFARSPAFARLSEVWRDASSCSLSKPLEKEPCHEREIDHQVQQGILRAFHPRRTAGGMHLRDRDPAPSIAF